MGNPLKILLNNGEEDKKDNIDENEDGKEENHVINNNINNMKNLNNLNNNPNNNINNMNYNNMNPSINNENDDGNNFGNNNNDMNNTYNMPNDNNPIDVNNLRPLIGSNGKLIKDAQNNYVLLDENNKPVKNTGITLLLDQTGKPVLNSKSKPILIDIEGKPINLEDNNNNIGNNPNLILNPELFYANDPDLINNKKPKKKYSQKKENQSPFYQKTNSQPKEPYIKNKINKGYIKNHQKPILNDEKNKIIPKNNHNIAIKNMDNYGQIPIKEKKNLRNKRGKGKLNYSECEPESIKKINFMGHNEYKGACFACDVGCSISRSGYSPMNYSPYNNLIKRREVTPIKNSDGHNFNGTYNIRVNKNGIEKDNNYYLTEI